MAESIKVKFLYGRSGREGKLLGKAGAQLIEDHSFNGMKNLKKA